MTGNGRASSRSNRARRVDAAHVLNFRTYQATSPPTNSAASPQPRNRRRQHVRPRRREHFVAANSRFAINPDLGIAVLEDALIDPDTPLHWGAVDVVFVQREANHEDSRTCPICLQALSCPKITPCGHVFDHVCVLQHVAHAHPVEPAHSDVAIAALSRPNTSAKCPLCSCAFTMGSLKNVAFRQVAPVTAGVALEMTLVSASTGSTIAAPFAKGVVHEVPEGVERVDRLFSRFVFASRNYLLRLLAEMASDLRDTLAGEPSLKRFVDIAMNDVKCTRQIVRRRLCNQKKSGAVVPLTISPPRGAPQLGEVVTSSSLESDGSAGSAHAGCTKEEVTRSRVRLFYQSHDARNVYLHPINHRCLVYENGCDMTEAKTTICGRVLEIERYTMDDTLRKRYRFLKHLPEGCEFMLVELDLSHLLSKETVARFKGKLDTRKAARQRRKLSNKKESERVNKMQTESLHDYFRLSEHQRHQDAVPVDRNDETLFPALGSQCVGASSRNIPASRSSNADVGDVAASPGSAWGGAEISSYSSVTSNMGLFPALGASNTATSTAAPTATAPPRGAWATGSTPHAPTTGSSSSGGDAPQRRRRGGRATFTLLPNAGSGYRWS